MESTYADFELYEAVILSGQMPQERVPRFLEENLEFAKWYCERRSMNMEAET